jgi:cell division protein FtsB
VSAYARAAARPNIRWDRLSRVFLLGVLFVILCMYASPLHRWITQQGTASQDSSQLRQLQSTNADLRAKLKALQSPQALELRARSYGMVKQGERPFVIENLPR